ncbi:MAG: siderophore-interacting protein [Acidimicrobiia bacterium]
MAPSDPDPDPDTGGDVTADAGRRIRREPPRFRSVTVRQVTHEHARLVRLTLGGPDLDGFLVADPASSVRLLVPWPGEELVEPTWTGNEFLLADGRRPALRTLTPLAAAGPLELDVAVVLHGGGAVSGWAARARPGDRASISGPGRGHHLDPAAEDHVLAGDESALPAIGQLLEALPAGARARVHVEVADEVAVVPLPNPAASVVRWHRLGPGARPGDALVAAVAACELTAGSRVWVAGEAAAVQRIRRHLFDERGIGRAQATVRGYWKHGREGGDDG